MQEIKKIFILYKGLWIITAAVLLWLACFVFQPYAQVSEEYQYYLNRVSGKIDGTKENYIEEEAVRLAKMETERENLKKTFFVGDIPEDEYLQMMKSYEEKLERRQGFEQIYEQYLYICENKENRYFMDYRGWQKLFSGKLFLLFASTVILFMAGRFLCGEYDTNMDVVCKTCKESGIWLIKKIIMAEGIAGCMGAFLSILEYLLIDFFMGLEQGSFPAQSVPCLADSTKNMSCNEAFLVLVLLRILGCVFYADLILLISSFVRKLSLTVCLSAAMQILPLFGFTGSSMYRLPLPVSFMDAFGYLKGNQYEKDLVTGEDRIVFGEIPVPYIKMLIVLTLFLILIAGFWIIAREKNKWEHHAFFTGRRKRVLLSLILIFPIVFTCGCGKTGKIEKQGMPFNTEKSLSYEDDTVKIYFEGEGSYPIVEDKQTGKIRELISDPLQPLQENCEIKPELFYGEGYVYYVRVDGKEYYHKVGNNDSYVEVVSVHEVSLSDYSDRIIFEQQVGMNRQLFGMSYKIDEKWDFLMSHKYFFLNDKYLFFVKDDCIYQIERNSKKTDELIITSVGNIAFYKDKIYYINQKSFLEEYDIETGEKQQLLGEAVEDFAIYGDELYFSNWQDENTIWEYDFNTLEISLSHCVKIL